MAGVGITTVGFLACEIFPHFVSAMFTDSQDLIELANTGLRICVMMFPFVGCQIVITNFFQSIGKAKISIFLSLSRQLLFLLPGIIFLPRIMHGVNGVWTSMPISDFIAFVASVLMLLYHIKKMKAAEATASSI